MNLQGFYTTQGLALAAKTAAGAKLTVTKVTAGSGTTAASAAALAGSKQTLTVGEAAVSGETAVLPVTLAEAKAAASYTLTELGVYASDPDAGEILYQVFRLEEARVISKGGESVYRFYLRETVGAAGITVTCSSAGLLVDEDLAPTRSRVLAVSVPTRSISLAASEVQGYLDALPRLLTEGLEIKISGTVPETLTIRNFYGPGGLTITNQSGQTYALAKGMLLDNCDIPIIVWRAAITVDTAQETPHCVSISNTKYMYVSNCVLTGNGASHAVYAMGNQSTVLVGCTMTNHKVCAFAFRGAVLSITGGTFADNTTGAYVYDGGVILLGGTTPNLLGGTANSHGGGVIVSANGTVI